MSPCPQTGIVVDYRPLLRPFLPPLLPRIGALGKDCAHDLVVLSVELN